MSIGLPKEIMREFNLVPMPPPGSGFAYGCTMYHYPTTNPEIEIFITNYDTQIEFGGRMKNGMWLVVHSERRKGWAEKYVGNFAVSEQLLSAIDGKQLFERMLHYHLWNPSKGQPKLL